MLLISLLTFSETTPRVLAARQSCDSIAYLTPCSAMNLGNRSQVEFFDMKRSSPMVLSIIVVVDAMLVVCCA